ncbi:ABC transporter isoform A [Chlorella sorokiniana]|uniref:ABC transporter isoform A n=1 Tax=Chlorella sorokiniana TaxID=3076 RepID=A0A2P6TI51_CHLSO|nr:ABC transporter isoform A [Chlorella sorokiniana]|eukprot:PRW33949.1 ABC transporter isoform A [Chlorella sorokiniana]
MAASGAGPGLPPSTGSGPAPLEIEDDFEDVSLLLEAEQRQQERGWWARTRARLPAWLRPGGQQQDHAFQPLSLDEPVGSSSAYAGSPAAAAAGAVRPPGRWCPEEAASFVSRLGFNYVGGLIQLGYQKTLVHDDLWDVAVEDAARTVSDGFQWNLSSAQGVVWLSMWRTHGRTFIAAGAVKLVHDVVMFLGPFLLEQLLRHLQARGPALAGLGLATALAAASVLETLTINYYFHMIFRICLHLKIALVHALYRKSLRVSSAAKGDLGVGKIVNLQSNDASKLWSIPQYLHMIWSGPFQILVVMGLLVRIIHWAPALAGLGVTIALIPISALVGRQLAAVRRALVGFTDARVKLCTEVITGIKAIKLYSYEGPYVERITHLREAELRQIRKATLLSTVNNLIFIGGPVLISMGGFLTYSLLGYPLTASVAFPALALFNLLRFPVMMFPNQIMNLIAGKVALDRIQGFMESEEMQQAASLPPAAPGQPAVELQAASFAWVPGGLPLLHGINLNVPRGSLTIVVGSVGAGKSSLLAAMLGEMPVLQGSVVVRGSTAYTQQDSWIQNATLRDNILLGAPFSAQRYQDVVEACALRPDLEMLPAGDQTEIGEKGVNLSGGQKQRVALARACYAAADVYLLDDPLSAVDAHVGRHLFDRCICGLLGKTTRVLVTHQLQYLPAADEVVVLRDGRVAERGTYHQLLARGVDFHQFEQEDEGEEEAASPAGSKEDSAEELDGGRPGGSGADHLQHSHAMGTPTDSAIELQSRGGQGAGDANPSVSTAGSAAAMAGAVADGHTDDNGMLDASSGVCAAAETAAVFTEVPLLDSPAAAVDGGGGGSGAGAGSAPEGQQAEARGSNDYKFVPKPPPIMAPTRHNLLAPPATTNGTAGDAAGAAADGAAAAVAAPAAAPAGKLTKAEERAVGQVDRAVYLEYFRAWSPLFWIPLFVLSLALVERGLQALQNWWLSVWSQATADAEAQEQAVQTSYYMVVYFALAVSSLFFQLVKAVSLVLGSVNAARVLHERLLACVVRLPMSFFDSQPTGRLINRFTKDTESVDVALQSSVSSFLNCAVSVLWSLVVIVAVSPGIVAAILPLSLSYYYIQTRYIRSSREIKRLDSLALSPIFGHFGETLAGLMTVRAFRQQGSFEARNQSLLDHSNRAYWPAQCINRWLSVRLELLGISVVFGTAVLVTVAAPRSAGLAGLALTSSLSLTGLCNWMVRQTTELEVNMNAVERMVEYTSLEPEAAAIVEGHRPLPNWPQQGAVDVQSLVVRYRPDLDPVLKGVSFSVRGREKVGVAGRTGCGKSTLFLALYRIVEPSGGRIVIDGIDCSTIGLFDLRSRLALVPQDPVIFSGTVRSNLDLFGSASSDEAVWEALAQAGLASTVRGMPGGLDAPIKEAGSNLSVGQRQLLCMARALLRASRILVLDEATSNVDTATDALIQSTIASAFADCTVLTIAHRLHTIMDSDRILVLHEGRVREYDAPAALLAQPGSAFRGMVEETARHTHSSGGGGVQRTKSAKAVLQAVRGRVASDSAAAPQDSH